MAYIPGCMPYTVWAEIPDVWVYGIDFKASSPPSQMANSLRPGVYRSGPFSLTTGWNQPSQKKPVLSPVLSLVISP